MRPFRYESLRLDSGKPLIRLIELVPGGSLESIKCNLHKINLKDHPQYEAISYCWGTSPPSIPITCNGSRLEITESLHSALRRLRYEHGCRILWADQICIYLDRSRIKYRRNLRFEPLFSKGFGFAHSAFRLSGARKGSNYFASPTSVHIHMSLFGLLRAGSGSSTTRSPFVIQTHSLARFVRMRSNLGVLFGRVSVAALRARDRGEQG